MTRRVLLPVALLTAAAVATIAAILLFRPGGRPTPAPAQLYADPAACAQCHADAAQGYARSAMAHAFYTPRPENTVERYADAGDFYHAASDTHFSMIQRDGQFFQRRWQQGYQGKPENVEELRIDSIMGSGNHVRTYLHREQDGSLIELPLAWYAEKGGRWGVNPGYDSPQPPVDRVIAYECMFCHNGYPNVPDEQAQGGAHRTQSTSPVYLGALPEGIDCQRCHGPGQAHVLAARNPGASADTIRASIVNPAHLPPERQMQVCEQCHLETTSRHLPDRIRHDDRAPFSYVAGQPLEDFMAYFERDPAAGRTDNFEIVSAPYRLKQSRCFLESKGALTCETCHDPHDIPRGNAAVRYYANICLTCHAPGKPAQIAVNSHPASRDCITCHMPKRRTEDVVHAIMTDHLIQRRAPPAEVLLAERKEVEDVPANAYRGEVRRYPVGERRADDELYDATAQVMDSSNLIAGIPRLNKAIQLHHPARPEFAIELGDALRHAGDLPAAIEQYGKALDVDAANPRGSHALAVALDEADRPTEAVTVLERALKDLPDDALLWYQLAATHLALGRQADAIGDLRKAIGLKPNLADAQNALGTSLAESGDTDGAEAAFRAALTAAPYNAAIRANLGRLLAGRQDWKQAAFQFERSIRLDPTQSTAHSDYASVLAQLGQMSEAEGEAQAAIKLLSQAGASPQSAPAHILLGELFAQGGQMAHARAEFELALKCDPTNARAHLDLGLALLESGDRAGAIGHLQQAAHSSAPDTAQRASELLNQIGR